MLRRENGLPRYLWFHVFRRDTMPEVIDALRAGPEVNPDPACTTKLNEIELGIDEACVYAYLGWPVEEFGDCVLSVPMNSATGTVSPFDSGGLVEHISPVNGWNQERRRRYLAENSWTSEEIENRLELYPGNSTDAVQRYLDAARPEHDGPHSLFPPLSDDLIAPIWRDANDSRAWLWEIRVPDQLRSGEHLQYWSVSPGKYSDLLAYIDDVTDPVIEQRLEELMTKFIEGGASVLRGELRASQEAA